MPFRSSKERIVAVPKRRMSRSNTRHRRSAWKASVPALVTCVNPACRAKPAPRGAPPVVSTARVGPPTGCYVLIGSEPVAIDFLRAIY